VDELGVFSNWNHHHHGSPHSHITQGMNNRPVGGCRSEISYPIDMSNCLTDVIETTDVWQY
jgi:hypothetical protein